MYVIFYISDRNSTEEFTSSPEYKPSILFLTKLKEALLLIQTLETLKSEHLSG